MRINREVPSKQLAEYGFKKSSSFEELEKEHEEETASVLSCCEYYYEIGHSRRGQHYYLLVNGNREVSVYASKPDGSGGPIDLGNVLYRMMQDDIIHSSPEWEPEDCEECMEQAETNDIEYEPLFSWKDDIWVCDGCGQPQ